MSLNKNPKFVLLIYADGKKQIQVPVPSNFKGMFRLPPFSVQYKDKTFGYNQTTSSDYIYHELNSYHLISDEEEE